MQTRDQKYAVDVFNRVSRIPMEKEYRNSYGGMAHKLPILIRTAGLSQALSFVESRGSDAQMQLLKDLTATVGKQDLVKDARELALSEYIRLTQQVMAALLWYKRFAQSVLDVDTTATKDEAQ
jgi:CRISPR-associated protein Cmr5